MKLNNYSLSLAICLIANTFLPAGTLAGSESAQIQQQLNDNHSKWASKNIKDYQYTFNWSCYCPPEHNKPVTISVRNGVLSEVKYADGSGAVDKTRYSRYRTIEGLFEFLQEAINRKAYRIHVSYDARLGYPISAAIDYVERAVDEEMSFKAGGVMDETR